MIEDRVVLNRLMSQDIFIQRYVDRRNNLVHLTLACARKKRRFIALLSSIDPSVKILRTNTIFFLFVFRILFSMNFCEINFFFFHFKHHKLSVIIFLVLFIISYYKFNIKNNTGYFSRRRKLERNITNNKYWYLKYRLIRKVM